MEFDRPLLNEQRLANLMLDWRKQSGKRLQARRKNAPFEWSQEQLARLVGVQPGTISKAEIGVIVPKDSVRVAIANALLCEVSDIWPYLERQQVTMIAGESRGAAA